MTQHICQCDDQVFTCSRCSFRAVQTTRALFVLDPGDDKQQHLDAITATREARREWVYRTITRLRGQPTGDMALTARQRERLVRCLMMEYAE